MRRYGWDYDAAYAPRARRPARYDRGYRGGWGMTGLNESILHGPRPEWRGYDHALRREAGGRARTPRDRPPPRRFEPNPNGRFHVPRLPYDARRF